MFSLVKYLYYGNQKVEEPEVETVVDNEPEIIDSYANVTATHTQTEILSPKPTSSYVTPVFMEQTIEKCYNSSFVNASIFPKRNESVFNGPITQNVLRKLNTVFLVVKKSTGEPLGVYDSLNKAKEQGQKATYHNCQVIEYCINEPCKYLKAPVFENK
jgi:hypothetical protein